MNDRFIKYLVNSCGVNKEDKILLAISGGIDSTVMFDLFMKAKYSFSIAHCNFHLRGNDSDEDERFVEKLSEKYNIRLFKNHFQTTEYSKVKKLSIEMAARQLRYEWFEKIRLEFGFDLIATGHHLDDNVETFHMNLLRGTGIKGITGIKPRRGLIIRPLLFATRNEIINYSIQNNLEYRFDKSNDSLEYTRNKIRNVILPALREINPGYHQTIIENMNKLSEIEIIYNKEINEKRNICLKTRKNKIEIKISSLLNLYPLKTYLFEFLKPYNFKNDVVDEIIISLNKEPGKMFFSESHKLLKDRDLLIIKKKSLSEHQEYEITEKDSQLIVNVTDSDLMKLNFTKITRTLNFKITSNPNVAYLDLGKLKFPLVIRKWKEGDSFYPLGMDKKKKLSDFFIDNKISQIDKEDILLLTSQEEIVWIIGKRIDNRYKISDFTSEILQVHYSEQIIIKAGQKQL